MGAQAPILKVKKNDFDRIYKVWKMSHEMEALAKRETK